jgi:hypothetical protein
MEQHVQLSSGKLKAAIEKALQRIQKQIIQKLGLLNIAT